MEGGCVSVSVHREPPSQLLLGAGLSRDGTAETVLARWVGGVCRVPAQAGTRFSVHGS